jgi:polyisoprenoid-binding protein YceI
MPGDEGSQFKEDFMGKARILKGACIGFVVIFAILGVVVGGLLIFSRSLAGTAPPPLQLSQINSAGQKPNGPSPDGVWVVEDGSLAGFRVGVGLNSTIVGRTSAITGSLVFSQNEISSGSFQIDLRRLTIGGKQNASFFQLLETGKYPSATITLIQPVVFQTIPTDGQAISFQAPVSLAAHGITSTVTLTVMARDTGSVLEAAGSAPLLASDWKVKSPFAVHNDATIEFFLVLRRK